MKNIAIFYGGKSVEHDISLITGMQAMAGLSKDYKLIPIYIKEDGKMVTSSNLTNEQIYLDYQSLVKEEREVAFSSGKNEIKILNKGKIKQVIKIDCALLCTHGHGGEDGSLQGLLELCEIPYSSSSLPTSAICMDKVLTKIMLDHWEVLNPAYVYFAMCEYEANKDKILKKIKKELSFPCIVKPARLGSSVGISICESVEKLEEKIKEASYYDDKILVEKYIKNAREFCCACTLLSGKKIVSKVNEVSKKDLFTFEDKYQSQPHNEEKKVSQKIASKVQSLTEKCYELLECDGVVRIDFLYDEKGGNLYVNEVNSIPGSLAFNLFEVSMEDMLESLIFSSQEKYNRKKEIIYKFNSSAIEHYLNYKNIKK